MINGWVLYSLLVLENQCKYLIQLFIGDDITVSLVCLRASWDILSILSGSAIVVHLYIFTFNQTELESHQSEALEREIDTEKRISGLEEELHTYKVWDGAVLNFASSSVAFQCFTPIEL